MKVYDDKTGFERFELDEEERGYLSKAAALLSALRRHIEPENKGHGGAFCEAISVLMWLLLEDEVECVLRKAGCRSFSEAVDKLNPETTGDY